MDKTIQQHPNQGLGLPDGEYTVEAIGHTFAMKLITRDGGNGANRILMVISSSKWFRSSKHRWSGFAFYHPDSGALYVWHKFRGTKKRGRDWDKLAQAFREQIIAPDMMEKQHG